ncbi:MAG: uroporphyrinogen-III C-methyltransferase [Proteobacteria bacterium]|nr:uroporphyrinogen-III C-methyltransferase [Pseudomonadota bacterium]MBU1686478.1 uroporphyrinogen-III C-methyltransferase [Pseudomonadota bacterium]
MTVQENSPVSGKVYLVGAGPGDPGLITVKGKKLLKQAEVVVYDHLANKRLLKLVPQQAELIYAGKRGNVHHAFTQDAINQILIDRAQAGKRVIRLKGGDPFIFGRGGEEVEKLVAAGIAFEVVPGVTSATAAATYAGIPITHRDYTSSVAFITGHEDPTKTNSRIAWDKISTGIGTLVFYMGIKNLASIAERLMEHGRPADTKVAVIRWASTPMQRSVVGTLANIAERVIEEGITPPALVVVGEVVALRDTINWYEKKPLLGKRILVTRTREQASELIDLLEEDGAACLEGATIALVPPDSWQELDECLARLNTYDWILFTSINAIQFFFKRLQEKGMDARALSGSQVGVVGTTTAKILLGYGIKADLLPEEFTGEGLAQAMLEKGVTGKKILIPRALEAREILPKKLQEAGAEVTVAPVYKNIMPEGFDEVRKALEDKEIDLISFTSSSTVKNFLELLSIKDESEFKTLLDGVKVAVIGPITAKTARNGGLTVDIEPEEYTIPAMVRAIQQYYEKK